MTEVFKDFDTLIVDKRTAILAGKTFDVSKISTRDALKYVVFRDKVLTMSGEDALRKMAAIVADICGKSVIKGGFFTRLFNKPINEKWLIENTNYEQLQAFIDFVLEPLLGKKTDEPEADKKKVNQEQSNSEK
jgi:hypothetical protein